MTKNKDNSHSLEVISKDHKHLEKRKHPRVTFGEIQFRLDDNGKIFGVWDLSLEGFALRIIDPNDLALLSVGREIKGSLNFDSTKIHLHAKVVRQSQSVVGLLFLESSAQLKECLDHYLKPEIVGQQIQLLPSSELNSQFWAHGPAGVDLLFRRDPESGKLVQILFYFMNCFVRWSEQGGLETGSVVHSDEQALHQGVLEYEPILLKPEENASKDKLEYAKKLLQSAGIPEELKLNSLKLLS